MQINQDEQYWINSLKREDEQALSWFFKLHHKSLRYFASRLVQDPIEAEDIVADCFLKLWERNQDFETEQNVKAFLYISCRNACLNHLKHLKVRSKVQDLYFEKLEQGEDTILYQIIRTEVLDILVKEIEYLPEKCQEVFKLIYFDHKKTDEIAEHLGISVKTVRNHKARAIELLKTVLLKKGVSGSFYLAFLLFIDHH